MLNRNQKPLIELTMRHAGSTGHSGQLCFYHKHTQEVCQGWPQMARLPDFVFGCNLLQLLYLLLFSLCRSQETPLLRIEPQRWLTSTPTSPSTRNRTFGSELFHPCSVCWIPDVFLTTVFMTSHLHRPLDASSTCCVLSSTHSRMEPNCRLSMENIPFRKMTSNM